MAKEYKGELPPKGSYLEREVDPCCNPNNMMGHSCGKGKLTSILEPAYEPLYLALKGVNSLTFVSRKQRNKAGTTAGKEKMPCKKNAALSSVSQKSFVTFSKKSSGSIGKSFKQFMSQAKDLTAQRFEMKHIVTMKDALIEDLEDQAKKQAGVFTQRPRHGQDQNPNVFNKVLTWYSKKFIFPKGTAPIKSAVIRARAYEFYDKDQKTRQRDAETSDDIYLEIKAVVKKPSQEPSPSNQES